MNTVIFDLDGTLCDITHRLHHIDGDKKDWDAFYADCINDEPKENIIEFCRCMDDAGHKIIISSGRSENVRKQTIQWLDKHEVPYSQLLMRPDKCYTPDNALKKAWLDKGALGDPNDILFVVEDRDRMVQMWRGAGLTCLQVDQWVEEGEVSYPLRKIEVAREMASFISDTKQVERFNIWKGNKK